MEEASTILLFMPFYTQANTIHLLFLSLFIWKIEIILDGVMPSTGYRERIIINDHYYFPPLYGILEDYITKFRAKLVIQVSSVMYDPNETFKENKWHTAPSAVICRNLP